MELNIIITGNQEITDDMKNCISSKIVKLAKYTKKIDSASVILTVEKKRQSAVVVIWADGTSLTSKGATGDIYSSVDSALTKMELQFKKHYKTNRVRLYATIIAWETYLNDFGFEFLGIV